MNLKRVPVRLDEPTGSPLIPGLRASQQETLIHVVGSNAHHLSPRQTAAGTQTHRTITIPPGVADPATLMSRCGVAGSLQQVSHPRDRFSERRIGELLAFERGLIDSLPRPQPRRRRSPGRCEALQPLPDPRPPR